VFLILRNEKPPGAFLNRVFPGTPKMSKGLRNYPRACILFVTVSPGRNSLAMERNRRIINGH